MRYDRVSMRRGLTLLVVVALGACGDDAGSGEAVPVAGFCAAWVDAVCGSASRCGCGDVIAELETRCAELAGRGCPLAEGAPLRMGVDDGSVSYDDAAAGRLVSAIGGLRCDAAPPCALVSCLGLSAEGGPCGSERSACVTGLVCMDGACGRPIAAGQPCSESAHCASGRCEAGTCAAKAEDGAACAEDPECESTRCDFSTGRCRAPEPLEGLCMDHADCASAYCDRDLELGAGNCRDRRPDGETCDEDPQCAGGACIGGVCASAICDSLG